MTSRIDLLRAEVREFREELTRARDTIVRLENANNRLRDKVGANNNAVVNLAKARAAKEERDGPETRRVNAT